MIFARMDLLLEVYGTAGTVYVPDPNFFQGPIRLCEGRKLQEIIDAVQEPHPAKLIAMVTNQKKVVENVPITFPHSEDPFENFRGIGVSDMAQALLDHRPARLSGPMALHVVEAMNAFELSARTGQVVRLESTCERTEPMDPSWALWEVR